MRAALYARVSGDDRKTESLGQQLEMCRKFAEEQDYSIIAELSEDERGVSGAELEAPELERAIGLAREGLIDVVICREMDRLARSLGKQLFIEIELERHGAKVEYVLAKYDDSPEGQLQKLVRASIAEYERLKIVERTERGRRAAIRRGSVMTGGHPPFGYLEVKLDSGKRTFEPDPETAPHARQIFQWYAHGDGETARLSLAEIARRLEAQGILSSSDRGRVPRKKARPPGSWRSTSVRRILINPAYYGEWTYNASDGTSISVEIPALVDRKTWEICQGRLKENLRRAKRNTRHQYLLRSRIRCGKCGYMMSVRKNNAYVYYYCAASEHRDLRVSCDQRYIRVDKLDERLWEKVVNLFSVPGAVRKAYLELNEMPKANDAEMEQVAQEIERLEGRLLRLRHLYLDGDVDRPEYQSTRNVLRAELNQLMLRQQLLYENSSKADNDILSTLDGFTEAIREEIANATDFKERLWYIDTLDINATVTAERIAIIKAHGIKIGEIHCD